MKTADVVGGAIGLAVGTFVLVEGTKMPEDVVMKIGPSFFPSLLAVGLILFSGILIVKAFVGGNANGKDGGGFEPIDFRDFGIWRALIALAASIVYALLLKPVGFLPLTVLFVLGLMLLLGVRKPLELVLVPPLTTFAVWLVFVKLLTISLPMGVLSYFGF